MAALTHDAKATTLLERLFENIDANIANADASEVSASGTLSAADEYVELEIRGRRTVGVHVVGALSASMDLLMQHSGDGVTFGERFFWNGDNAVVFDHYPHALNNERFWSVALGPGITHVRVKVNSWTSGSVVVTITANEQDDATLYAGVLPKSLQSIPTTLDDVDDNVQMTVYGDAVGFFVEAGNLTGTLVVEGSPTSHGSVWINIPFYANNQWRLTGYAIASPATGFAVSPMLLQGLMRYRLRLSVDGGGACVAHGRVGGVKDTFGHNPTLGIPIGVAPTFAQLVGGKDGAGNMQALLTDTGGAMVPAPSRISISPTVTVSASPDYSSGDVVGGELTLTNACRIAGGYTRLSDVVLTNAVPGVPWTGAILFFDADPAGTYTDNSAFPSLATDVAKLVGRVDIASGDWATFGGYGVAHLKGLNLIMKSAATANLWAVPITTAAMNLAATTDITAKFNFER